MDSVVLQLHISADDFLRWYQGRAQAVHAQSEDGRRVQFPAAILQPFVSRDGIHGRFRINFDSRGQYQGIERLNALSQEK